MKGGKVSDDRKRYEQAVKLFIKGAMAGRKKKHVFVVKLYPGAGKTYGIVQQIRELEPVHVYLAPRHDIIDQNFRGFNVPHLMSRNRFLDDDKRVPLCLLARENDHLIELIKKGKIDMSSMCNSCRHRSECDYWVNKRIIEMDGTSWHGVHAHLNSFMEKHLELEKDYDLLVIDENPFNSLFKSHRVDGFQELNKTRDIVTRGIEGDESILDLVTAMELMLKKQPPEKYFDRAIEHSSTIDKFVPSYNEVIRTLAGTMPASRFPSYNFILTMVDIISKAPTIEYLRKRIVSIRYRGNYIQLMSYDNSIFTRLEIPTILLDATAKKTVIQSIFGPTWSIEPILEDPWRYRNVTHCKGCGEFYKVSWERILANFMMGKNPFQLVATKRICLNSPRGVLFIAQKEICEGVRRYLENENGITNARFLWPYGLTSDNKYWEDCDVVVLLNRPMPPRVILEMYSEISGLPASEITYIFVESEIIQAIGRIRQSNSTTTPRLDNGEWFGKKKSRKRRTIHVIIFPELRGVNPFKDDDRYAMYNYTRIGMYSYFKHVLGKGYVGALEARVRELQEILEGNRMCKTEIIKKYPYRSTLERTLKYLESKKIIKKKNGKYEWMKNVRF